MLNNITIMGRLTRDPELRRTQNGIAVTSFSIACDRDYKPENGERETDFIDCVAWRGTAEFVQKYFAKGRMAVVSGRLQIRPWTDKDGNKRRSAEIVAENVYFGDSKRDGDGNTNAAPQGYSYTGAPPTSTGYTSAQQSFPTAPPAMSEMDELDEDDGRLPF
jgi:single-strand DNA-binding protein